MPRRRFSITGGSRYVRAGGALPDGAAVRRHRPLPYRQGRLLFIDDEPVLVHLGQAVINFKGPIDYFIHSTFNVPTASEAYKYAAYDGLRNVGR